MSSDGIGARSLLESRSLSTMNDAPSSMASSTSSHIASRRARMRLGAVVDAVEALQRLRRARADPRVDVHDLRELVVVDHREVEGHLARVVGPGRQQVALGAERRAERRDDRLADRVERRVRDLRELLREVVEEQARTLRQHRDRGVASPWRRAAPAPVFAIGVRRIFTSSSVYPNVRWRRFTDAGGCTMCSRSGSSARRMRPASSQSPHGSDAASSALISSSSMRRPGLGVDEEHAPGLQAALAHDRGSGRCRARRSRSPARRGRRRSRGSGRGAGRCGRGSRRRASRR